MKNTNTSRVQVVASFLAKTVISISLLFLCAAPVSACDPCALYNVTRLHGHSNDHLTLFLSEQYTEYDDANSIQDNSIRDGELTRSYSTTQFGAAYDVTDRFGLQLAVPLIVRHYEEL